MSEIALMLRGAASRVRRLCVPHHRGRRFEHLGQELARVFSEGSRIVLRNKEVVVLSWPKSGRTWLRYMLDQVGIHLEYTHQCEFGPFPRDWESKRIIFLHRDPRDTTVSHWFAVTRRGAGYDGSLSDFLREPELGLERVMRFNLFWKEWLDRAGGHLILTYEGLHADPAGELERAVAFVGAPFVPAEALRRAVTAGRFENMHAVEASGRGARLYGGALMPGDPKDPDSFKTRRGRIGSWREHFSPADTAFADALLDRSDYFRLMVSPSAGSPPEGREEASISVPSGLLRPAAHIRR